MKGFFKDVLENRFCHVHFSHIKYFEYIEYTKYVLLFFLRSCQSFIFKAAKALLTISHKPTSRHWTYPFLRISYHILYHGQKSDIISYPISWLKKRIGYPISLPSKNSQNSQNSIFFLRKKNCCHYFTQCSYKKQGNEKDLLEYCQFI
jgi:hypothetical protein